MKKTTGTKNESVNTNSTKSTSTTSTTSITSITSIDKKGPSISKRIQALSDAGHDKKTIVQMMTVELRRPIRYQHIYNVLKNRELRQLELQVKGESKEEVTID